MKVQMTITYRRQVRPDEGPALEHAQRHDSSWTHAPLPSNECSQEDRRHREQRVDGWVAPRLGRTTLLKGKQERCRHPNADDGANPVEVEILLPPIPWEVSVRLWRSRLKEPRDEGHSHPSHRHVDYRICEPPLLLSENPAKQKHSL
jgi:hypothetical protein